MCTELSAFFNFQRLHHNNAQSCFERSCFAPSQRWALSRRVSNSPVSGVENMK